MNHFRTRSAVQPTSTRELESNPLDGRAHSTMQISRRTCCGEAYASKVPILCILGNHRYFNEFMGEVNTEVRF